MIIYITDYYWTEDCIEKSIDGGFSMNRKHLEPLYFSAKQEAVVWGIRSENIVVE